jgi:CRISPR system Cascade subunit CasA
MNAFAEQYEHRFDLFSESTPFLQSADLPLQPGRDDKGKLKSVSQLTAETSRSTALEHYRHGRGMDEHFCPACAARGLVTIPPFVSSGGRGLKPSINGVPPIYVLPGGATLFESLVASLVLPDYQPAVRSWEADFPWWLHPPVVSTGDVVEVGYLHSLTFPARRVRLHPERATGPCTRCGEESRWSVRTMIMEMGESRAKDAPFWQDPFAAYRQRGGKNPIPIRPQAGKALWREYAGLFVAPHQSDGVESLIRPRVLDQIAELGLAAEVPTYPFRCIGVRTDMKAKIFDWMDVGFDVPPAVLQDEEAALHIAQALNFAGECEQTIGAVFRSVFGGKGQKTERHRRLKEQMRDAYWTDLASPFRGFVLALGQLPIGSERQIESGKWANRAIVAARGAFEEAAKAVGDDAASLRQRVQGEERCRRALHAKRKEFWIGKE